MKVVATTRTAQGSSASRRLRHSGKVPGIVYGGSGQPTPIELDHNPLYHSLRVEAFHSSILDMELDGKPERVLLRNVQWHAYKPQVVHIDFQRIDAAQKIHVKVPLHFMNQEICPAVKVGGGVISHVTTEIDITCLPGDLPEFIEVDVSELAVGSPMHLSAVKLPPGVTPVIHGKDDPVLATVTIKGGGADEDAAAAATPAAAAAVAPAPAAAKK
jgi:large subunit ribosomal protein L25